MLTIEKTVLPSPAQWEIIIEGMRNPMNSWDKSDSHITYVEDTDTFKIADHEHILGDNDLCLMRRLAAGGSVHAKYRRMIPVFVTINAPRFWWTEFDTYKIGTVANSCSTMHKIHAKEFTVDDFSCEHLIDSDVEEVIPEDWVNVAEEGYFTEQWDSMEFLKMTVRALNVYRSRFLETKDKKYWWQMIQLLPQSYNQKRTVMLNYEVLVNIYRWRRDHKLDCWHTFCDWIESLPYSELITGKGVEVK